MTDHFVSFLPGPHFCGRFIGYYWSVEGTPCRGWALTYWGAQRKAGRRSAPYLLTEWFRKQLAE